MTTAPQPGSGENEPNNEALEDGLRNLVNEALTLPSNAQIPTNKQTTTKQRHHDQGCERGGNQV